LGIAAAAGLIFAVLIVILTLIQKRLTAEHSESKGAS
jgi:ABC-type sugar transport system permease subunit